MDVEILVALRNALDLAIEKSEENVLAGVRELS